MQYNLCWLVGGGSESSAAGALLSPAKFRLGICSGQLVTHCRPCVLGDHVFLEPEFVDCFLRTAQSLPVFILLIVRVLDEDLTLGDPRVGLLPNIARCCNRYASECSTGPGQGLLEQSHLPESNQYYLQPRLQGLDHVKVFRSIVKTYLRWISNGPIVHPCENSNLWLIIILTHSQFWYSVCLTSSSEWAGHVGPVAVFERSNHVLCESVGIVWIAW